MTRRECLIATAGAGLSLCFAGRALAAASTSRTSAPAASKRYKISAADWMMLKRQKPGALQLAQDCGLDGVELDMGPLGIRPDFENNLIKDSFRMEYVETAKKLGLEISSLAMSAFYGQSFSKHPSAERFANTAIELMPKLATRVLFIPVFTRADLKKEDADADAAVQKNVVAVFKRIVPAAEKAGVIIGISTQLDSAGNIKLLDEIASPSIRIAYNCGEAVDAGRDVYKELSALGKDRIAEIVPTLSDGVWLKDDQRIDVLKLKAILDEMGWGGWLVLQRSRDAKKSRDVKYNFGANAAYLKSVFQE
jgi:sugar phosphate isomerase/epimerase